jgi:quercetin dioxygenase-like cupin family protein
LKVQRFASLLLLLLSITAIARIARSQSSVGSGAAKVEFENDQIRVLRASLGAYQKTPMHRHPSRIGITITENDLRLYLRDGTSTTSTRGAHEIFWSEPVTHQVENLSNEAMQNIEIELKRATGMGTTVKSATVESKAQGTATDPVTVEQEPHHHVVFENQYVRVLDVVVNPGDTTLFHKHSLDNVAVQLNDANIKRQFPGEDWVATPAKEGSVGFVAGTRTPYTHRISNAGTTVFHVLDVEILP